MDDNISRTGTTSDIPIINIANLLTVLRFILIPAFIVLFLHTNVWARWGAALVFVIAAATDRFDGQIARSRGLITNFGRIADPIADKALTLGAFILFSVTHILPWWFTIIVAVRELGVTLARVLLLRRGIVASANRGGKIKTVFQMLSIFILVLPWDKPYELFSSWNASFTSVSGAMMWLSTVVAAIALCATVWTGLEYAREALRVLRVTYTK